MPDVVFLHLVAVLEVLVAENVAGDDFAGQRKAHHVLISFRVVDNQVREDFVLDIFSDVRKMWFGGLRDCWFAVDDLFRALILG